MIVLTNKKSEGMVVRMKNKKVLFGILSCTILIFSVMSPVLASTSPVQKPIKNEKEITNKSEDLDIAKTFPDKNFQDQIRKYDTNNDGFLSPEEVRQIKTLTLSNISDLTGIKFLTSLSHFEIKDSSLTTMDLRGMTSVQNITYLNNNPRLKTLDLRDCTSLQSAFHSVNGETVWISAGMTNFIGCPGTKEHTGNINIDLENIATINPDGSKQVKLSNIISDTLLSVFEQNIQPGYDKSTKILTIPAGEDESHYAAGIDINGASSTWTFYTNADDNGDDDSTWPDGSPNGWKDFAGNNLNLVKDPANALFGDYVFYSDEQSAIYKEFKDEESFEPGNYRVTVYAKGTTDAAPTLPLKVSLKQSPSSGDSRILLLANPLSSGEKVEKGYYKVSADVELSEDERTPFITVENYQGGYIAGISIKPIN